MNNAPPRHCSPLDKWALLRFVMADERSVGSDIAVAFWLLEHMNGETGACFPSYSTLAGEAHYDRSTVIDAAQRLVQREYFAYRKGGPKKGSNRYTANFGLLSLVVPTPPPQGKPIDGQSQKPDEVVAPTPPGGGADPTPHGGADPTLTCESNKLKEPVNAAAPKKKSSKEEYSCSPASSLSGSSKGARQETEAHNRLWSDMQAKLTEQQVADAITVMSSTDLATAICAEVQSRGAGLEFVIGKMREARQ